MEYWKTRSWTLKTSLLRVGQHRVNTWNLWSCLGRYSWKFDSSVLGMQIVGVTILSCDPPPLLYVCVGSTVEFIPWQYSIIASNMVVPLGIRIYNTNDTIALTRYNDVNS